MWFIYHNNTILDDLSFRWAIHFKKMRNTCNNMKPAVGHTRFGKSSAMFIQQYKTGNILYVIVEKLHKTKGDISSNR